MRFIGNQPGYGTSPPKSKKLMYFAAGLVLIILIGLVMFTGKDKSPEGTGEYYDPGSGETVSNPEGKTPDVVGADNKAIVFLGFSKFYPIGVTRPQVEATKINFTKYSESRSEKATEISVYVDTIKRVPFGDDTKSPRKVTFDVLINRKDKYQAVIEYTSIKNAALRLSQDGKEVFYSGLTDPEAAAEEDEHSGQDVLQPEYPR